MKIDIQKIDLKEKIKDFAQYLATTDRIILSAKFGDGKTYLLNQLRQDASLSNEYKFFTIYPVNYSVAKNEDIFEYIKRDVIVQLNKEGLLDKVDINAVFNTLLDFDDVKSLVSFLLSFIPGGDFCDKVFNKFCDKKEEYEKQKITADKYLSSFVQIKGGIYENDGFTALIKGAIDWIKEDHVMNGPDWKKKKSVLIVEDLDRLDPKHLFRILNVLSAHIDDTSTPDVITNKFGFNNIVLVMDYETTAHIFHHFYGKKACYEGYMSKFLSREPFRYSIRPYVAFQIEREISLNLGISNVFHKFSNFRNRISQLSVRDLKKLTQFNTDDRVKSDFYEFQDIKLSTTLPLFHLIIYMAECGMPADEIVSDFNSCRTMEALEDKQVITSEYMRLMFPFYAIAQGRNIGYFNYGVANYSISKKKKDDIITDLKVEPTMGWDNSIVKLEKIDIENTIRWCLDNFSTSINMAAL